MLIAEFMLPEFDQEMANTRMMLERVPEDRFTWKPHENSRTMGELAAHIADLPSLGTAVMATASVDMAGYEDQPPSANTLREILALFDEDVETCRRAIAQASDQQFMERWSLLHGDTTMATMPRLAALRSLLLSPIIHHRAQLGVYLRLNDVPVPGMYGPSGDEEHI